MSTKSLTDRYCRSFNTTNNLPRLESGSSRGTGKRGRWGDPYLQRSSCVDSRTFFLFLLLPWWWGLLRWWLLLLEEELCCPWWPLFWWERDILACGRVQRQVQSSCRISLCFIDNVRKLLSGVVYYVLYEDSKGKAERTFPPLLPPGGVLAVWLCVRRLVTTADFSLWLLEPRPDCCLAVLHGVPSESWEETATGSYNLLHMWFQNNLTGVLCLNRILREQK